VSSYTDDQFRAVASDIELAPHRVPDVDDIVRGYRWPPSTVTAILGDMVHAGILHPDRSLAAVSGRAAGDLAVAWINGGPDYRNHRRATTGAVDETVADMLATADDGARNAARAVETDTDPHCLLWTLLHLARIVHAVRVLATGAGAATPIITTDLRTASSDLDELLTEARTDTAADLFGLVSHDTSMSALDPWHLDNLDAAQAALASAARAVPGWRDGLFGLVADLTAALTDVAKTNDPTGLGDTIGLTERITARALAIGA